MEAWIAKTPSGHLVPADDKSRETLRTVHAGEIFKIHFKRNRNYENHKRFFAFINTTFEMQDHFKEVTNYRKWLTMKAGHYDTIVAPNGNTIFQPKSISFEEMEEDEFRELFSTCIDVFLRELGKGMTRDEVLRVVDFD